MRHAHIHASVRKVSLQAFIFFTLAGISAFCADVKGTSADIAFFEARIRPILVQNCYECHSLKSGKSKGHLRVDSRDVLLSGGETGPAFVPGDPAKSLLMTAVNYRDENTQMPPKGKLPQALIDDLTQWLKAGAPWPEEASVAIAAAPKAASSANYEKLRAEHWCWQPMKSVALPSVVNSAWAASPIDSFILAALEKNRLAPAPAGEKRVLLRRLCFDLTGLPPTVEESVQFLNDTSPDAIAKLVDRLLASPHFGERWGRHWMDVVRYADSVGYGANITFDNAWRYRDYIVNAFNSDKPYDQFLREQLAGDLLPATNAAQSQEQRVATAFLAIGPKELAEYDKEKLRWDIIDEQIDTMGQAFMAMTLGCARCHDHKFDPIPTRDYYALAGIFGSTDTLTGSAWEGPISDWVEELLVPGKENAAAWSDYDKKMKEARGKLKGLRGQRQELKNLEAQLKDKRAHNAAPAEIAATEAALEKKRSEFRPSPEVLKNLESALAKAKADSEANPEEIKRLTADVAKKKALPDGSDAEMSRVERAFEAACERPRPARITTVRDAKTPANSKIHIRGETQNLGDEAPRGFLSSVRGTTMPSALKGSGRLELAQWLTQPEHPLTARVMANRVWSHLFGAGLVRTVDNFGVRGEVPTHPELLDYLSLEFVRGGWSVKKLIREIVLSRTYQMDCSANTANLAADPENKMLWRQNRRRLEAEPIRDAMLQISGQLDATVGGNTMMYEGRLFVPDSYREIKTDPFRRRTLYVPIYRGALQLDMLEAFNVADPGMVTGRRASTQIPTQSLYLMNSPFVMEQAAKTVQSIAQLTPAARLQSLYTRVLGRLPSSAETNRALAFLAAAERDSSDNKEAWNQLCQALLVSNEFLFVE